VLEGCGISAEVASEASTLESDACFAKPVRFDIVAGDRKLSGAAQRRTREGMLHQGSILLPDPKRNGDVRRSFTEFFTRKLELEFFAGELTKAELSRVADLERERYSTEAWNRMK
jgi:lipoate-protein ligase A